MAKLFTPKRNKIPANSAAAMLFGNLFITVSNIPEYAIRKIIPLAMIKPAIASAYVTVGSAVNKNAAPGVLHAVMIGVRVR